MLTEALASVCQRLIQSRLGIGSNGCHQLHREQGRQLLPEFVHCRLLLHVVQLPRHIPIQGHRCRKAETIVGLLEQVQQYLQVDGLPEAVLDLKPYCQGRSGQKQCAVGLCQSHGCPCGVAKGGLLP